MYVIKIIFVVRIRARHFCYTVTSSKLEYDVLLISL